MKNTMQPMNQNQNEQQNDAFHKINAASQQTISLLRKIISWLCVIAFTFFSATVLYRVAGSSDEVKGVFWGHTFSLYYTFQSFFDGLAASLYSIIPADGMFYERCLRTIPGILLILYCLSALPHYERHHIILDEELSYKEKYDVQSLKKLLCAITALLVCIMACDRGKTGSFLSEFVGKMPLIIPCVLYSIPIFIITYAACHKLYITTEFIYCNKDIRNALISIIIILFLIIAWMVFNSFWLLIRQFLGLFFIILVGKVIVETDYIIIFF